MTHSTIVGYALALSVVLASGSAAAEAAPAPITASTPSPTAPTAPGERETTLQRANDDLLRQLRPTGLKRHAQGFGALAKRGYADVVSKVSGKPAKR